MNKIKDLSGNTFGLLTVISRAENVKGKPAWNCLCKCGNNSTVTSSHLKAGTTSSCGCIRINRAKILNLKHGDALSKEYSAWKNLISRCTDPDNKSFKDYGGRGITVFCAWVDSYENFLADAGRAPSRYHMIDRIDTNGNYEPNNIKWSTRTEQNSNRRNNRYYIYNGESITLSEVSRRVNIKVATLRRRIFKAGMTFDDAVLKPIRNS